MFSKKRLIDIGLVIIILVMGVFVYFQINRIVSDVRDISQNASSSQEPTVVENPTPTLNADENQDPTPAPEFELTSLEGDAVSLSDFRGQAVMINFWAIWCQPCRAELPLIQDFADRYQDELAVLAINMGEDRTNVEHFVNEFDYDLIFLLDPSSSVAPKFMVRGLPTSVFIDEDGWIQGMHIGLLNESLLSDYLSQVGVAE